MEWLEITKDEIDHLPNTSLNIQIKRSSTNPIPHMKEMKIENQEDTKLNMFCLPYNLSEKKVKCLTIELSPQTEQAKENSSTVE